MADPVTARPVSGEMMAAGPTGSIAAGDADVIDADYVEIKGETRQAGAPAARDVNASAQRPGMAMLSRSAGGPRLAARGGPMFWAAGAIVAAAAFWAAGGHAVLRGNLPLAAGQPAPQLLISEVRSRAEKVEGEVALLVDGSIRNDGEVSGPVPALIVHVLSVEGRTTNYRLGTLRTPLAPGAKYSFSSRLDMPKDGVKTVTVTFDD